ncbi:hypothetical protein HQQ81_00235 [Microbacteriaceae bacterium VKM Ac-2854]|nr:hypothetical protein [Microbacteriaceae bacterium VKM Ac-2854]
MRIELRGVAKGKLDAALPPVTLGYESGTATLALTETQQRPTVLGLIASGRMKPDVGTVTVDSREDGKRMRASIALVDAPVVSEPAPDVSLSAVVAEELMFAGLPSHPFAVARQLEQFGAAGLAKYAMSELPAAQRIRVLCELALLRDGVLGLVLVSPDRHGGDPTAWWGIAQQIAARGIAVLVIAGTAAASAIAADAFIRSQSDGDEPEPAVGLDELFAESDETREEATPDDDASAETTPAEAAPGGDASAETTPEVAAPAESPLPENAPTPEAPTPDDAAEPASDMTGDAK